MFVCQRDMSINAECISVQIVAFYFTSRASRVRFGAITDLFLTKSYKRHHGVRKSQKKSHSTLRAKRATNYILSAEKLMKNAKNGRFWQVFENLKLAVK